MMTIKRAVSFREMVQRVVRDIPKGKTMTYKEVALKAGSPNAARAVGMIMSHNTDTSIPCHRVIRSDGKIGGYNGIRDGKQGKAAKQALLAAEGAL
jgi:O-6-methylguanine DNA methyltransferase